MWKVRQKAARLSNIPIARLAVLRLSLWRLRVSDGHRLARFAISACRLFHNSFRSFIVRLIFNAAA
jgi:hypothetical protein